MYIAICEGIVKVGSSLRLAVEASAGTATDAGRQGRDMVADDR